MWEAESDTRVPVNDMFYRQLIRSRRLNVTIALPFFSTVQVGVSSWLQNYRDQKVQASQQVDLHLRRLMYYQSWHPNQCSATLQSIVEDLSQFLPSSEIGGLVEVLLEICRAKGWTTLY